MYAFEKEKQETKMKRIKVNLLCRKKTEGPGVWGGGNDMEIIGVNA